MAVEPARLENLCVLYQSDDYIVVDKHWDIRIDSKMWYEKLTVQAQLKYHFPQLADHSTYYGFRSETLTYIILTKSNHFNIIIRPSLWQVLSSAGFLNKWRSLCCPQ